MLTALTRMSRSEPIDKNAAFRQRHAQRHGAFHNHQGGLTVRCYRSQDKEKVTVALKRAAMVEFPEAGVLEVEGQDAERMLHLLLTQDIASMSVGETCWSSALDRHGRLLHDLRVWRRGTNHFLLLCPPGQAETLSEHIAFHRVCEDVEIREPQEAMTRCLIFGARIAPALGIPHHAQAIDLHELRGVKVLSAPGPDLGLPARDLLIPTAHMDTVTEELEKRGALLVGTEVFDGLRIESGLPLWNVDGISEQFPNECGFTYSMGFSKGCYLGQEIVGRIFQLGPRTKLMGVRLGTADPPAQGEFIVLANGPVTQLTSVAWCPQTRIFGGLTVLPAEMATAGLEIWLRGQPDDPIGTLADLPFLENG